MDDVARAIPATLNRRRNSRRWIASVCGGARRLRETMSGSGSSSCAGGASSSGSGDGRCSGSLNQSRWAGMQRVRAQSISLSRSLIGGPLSMRLSCAWVMPIHPATISCRRTGPWKGCFRYAAITRPMCQVASASRMRSVVQNSAGTSGGRATRSRALAWHRAHRLSGLSRARRVPQGQ